MTQPSARWTLTVRDQFAASHQLKNYGGKCESLHGHNFGVVVKVRGDKLDPGLGVVMDFADIKRELKAVLADLDHRHLNEIPEFKESNPSSENLARHIFRRLKPGIEKHGADLKSVTVSESDTSSATYEE